MHSDYKHDDDGCHTKYSNNEFDIIIQRKKGKNDNIIESCIVIDKRSKPIIYNDLSIAMNKLCN